MDANAWDRCDDPRPMLEALAARGGDRKLRLVSCELMRRDDSAALENERRAIQLAERWADGRATDAEVAAFNGATLDDPTHSQWIVLIVPATESVRCLIDHGGPDVRRLVVVLLREAFGNPFRPVSFSPEWRTSTAVAIAAQMYESRDFGAMPILADALQDAGCDDGDILDHCRNPGEHVRGCWVVDIVLGRS